MGPSWLLGTLAVVMIAVAAVSAARLAAASAAGGIAPARPGGKAVNGTSTPADGGQGAIDRHRRRGLRRRVTDADIDTAHLLMAIAMAGMLVAGLRTVPDGVWAAVFGVLAAWFAGRVLREARGHGLAALVGGHHTPHLVHSSAMLYMFLAAGTSAAGSAGSGGGPQMAGMAGMAGVSGAGLRFPTLALVLALALAGYAVRDLDRLTGSAALRDLGRPSGSAAGPGVGQLAGSAAFRDPGRLPGSAGVGDVGQLGGPAVAPGVGRLAGSSAGRAYQPAQAAVGTLATVTVSVPAVSDRVVSDRVISDPAGQGAAGRSAPGRGLAAAAHGIVVAPRVATGCRIVMGIVMAYMLIIMI